MPTPPKGKAESFSRSVFGIFSISLGGTPFASHFMTCDVRNFGSCSSSSSKPSSSVVIDASSFIFLSFRFCLSAYLFAFRYVQTIRMSNFISRQDSDFAFRISALDFTAAAIKNPSIPSRFGNS